LHSENIFGVGTEKISEKFKKPWQFMISDVRISDANLCIRVLLFSHNHLLFSHNHDPSISSNRWNLRAISSLLISGWLLLVISGCCCCCLPISIVVVIVSSLFVSLSPRRSVQQASSSGRSVQQAEAFSKLRSVQQAPAVEASAGMSILGLSSWSGMTHTGILFRILGGLSSWSGMTHSESSR
jgi:hypothetical protein